MWTTLGNSAAIDTLRRALASGRPSHAYIFAGPDGVGKRFAAVEFAAALNCETADPPCGVCRACRTTLAGQHPDVETIGPGGLCDESEHRDHEGSRVLLICQVRRLQHVLSLTPYGGGRRIAIVESAETLNEYAANAFLKTLEEPPPDTVLILLTKAPEELPETVRSRCQLVSFGRLPVREIEAALRERGAAPEAAAAVAAASSGRIGWAIRAIEDEALLARRTEMLETASRLPKAARSERFAWAAGASSRDPGVREAYREELEVWAAWWRDVMAETLDEKSRLYRTADVVRFLRALADTREYLTENVDPQLALENLVLAMPEPARR
jgi:DNA polymerase-3 subunit delta'